MTQAVLCEAYGPPESLISRQIPDPTPQQGEVVVDIGHAALNFFDTLIIENKYQVKPTLPFSPGGEFSGRISAIGPDVSGLAIGDLVCGFVPFGACRSKLAVPADMLFPVPTGLDPATAAGLLITYGTSLYALQNRAQLQKGETLAVLGASGGVGLAAVELGAALGARVIACASSAEKCDFALAHGASEAVNYSTADIKTALKDLTGGKGVDVLYDPVGGDLANPALRAMNWNGRYLVVGFAAAIPDIPLNLLLLKGSQLIGINLSSFRVNEPQAWRALATQVLELARENRISGHIHDILPAHRIAEALNLLKSRAVQGKLLIAF